MGTNSGPELLVELDRAAARPLRAQLEDGLREAVRSGRLAAARAAAGHARARGRPRRLAAAGRRRLRAAARRGLSGGPARRGHVRGRGRRRAAAAPAAEPEPRAAAFDFFPGYPDLASLSRGAPGCGRCARRCARRPTGPSATPTRAARPSCAARWPSTCGACAASSPTPSRSSSARARPRASRCWRARCAAPRMAVEDPGLPPHRAILTAHGATLLAAARSTSTGRACDELGAPSARDGRDRRRARHAGAPVADGRGARARAPGGAARVGGRAGRGRDRGRLRRRVPLRPRAARRRCRASRPTASSTWARSARRSRRPCASAGWCCPARLLDAGRRARRALADHGCPTLDQLALARLLDSGAYDRHLRQARRRYRARRDALVAGGRAPPARARG